VGEPFAPAHWGCGGRAGQGHCQARPVYAGLAYFPRSEQVWLGFACADHRWQLVAPREMTGRDRAELERRRDHIRAIREDHVPHVPVRPLAEGRAARELVERAKRWAAREA